MLLPRSAATSVSVQIVQGVRCNSRIERVAWATFGEVGAARWWSTTNGKGLGPMSLSESGVSASWSALSSQLPPALTFTLQPRPTDLPQIHAMAFNARKRCRSVLSDHCGLTCGSVLVSKLSSAGTDVSKPPFHQSRQMSHPPLSRFRQGVYAVCGEPKRFSRR
jgi:hypothetical protein